MYVNPTLNYVNSTLIYVNATLDYMNLRYFVLIVSRICALKNAPNCVRIMKLQQQPDSLSRTQVYEPTIDVLFVH